MKQPREPLYIGNVSSIKHTTRFLSFWPLQAVGWLCYGFAAAITFFPFRHMPSEVAFRAFYVIDAFLGSFVMYALCRVLWRKSVALVTSLVLCALVSYVLGVACVIPAISAQSHFGHPQPYSMWSLAFANATGAAFILLTWSALFFGFKHFKVAETHKELLFISEATARTAQLQALQYQLQPHFLFNTLNAISSLVVSGQQAQATEMLSKLATLLRSTLQSPEMHSVSLEDEIAVIDEYLDIEKVRFGERLRVRMILQRESRSAQVPRFLLQPLVENAIRHGIGMRARGGEIEIRASVDNGQLHIAVENDGAPSESNWQKGHGLGLHNSRLRLDRLYGNGASLTTSTKGERFLVSVTFPFEANASAAKIGTNP
jgi:two-component system sensor histidine kinase AlgZ